MRGFRPAILPVAIAMAIAALPAIARADSLAPTGRWSAYARGNAPLPPMGWNSWNAFGSDIDEAKVMGSAEAIVRSGLAAKGYRYIDLDDGWWLKRRLPDGRIIIRTANFPSAATADGSTSFRPFTDRLHAMGLKAGIYSDIGRNSCAQLYSTTGLNQPEGTLEEREVGLYGNVDRDIALYFAEWGFDLIKVDACGIRGLTPDSNWVELGQVPSARAVGRQRIDRPDRHRQSAQPVRRGPSRARDAQSRQRLRVLALPVGRGERSRLGQGHGQHVAHQRRHRADLGPDAAQLRQQRAPSALRPPRVVERSRHAVHRRRRLRREAPGGSALAPVAVGDDQRSADDRLRPAQGAAEPDRRVRQCLDHRAEPGPRRQPGGPGVRLQRHPDPRQDARRRRQGGGDLQSHLRPAQGDADRRPPQVSGGCRRRSHRPVDRRDDQLSRRARLRPRPSPDLDLSRQGQPAAARTGSTCRKCREA